MKYTIFLLSILSLFSSVSLKAMDGKCETHSDYSLPTCNAFNCAIAQGKIIEARERALKAIGTNPEQVFGYQWFVEICKKLKQPEKAIEVLKSYIKIKPQIAYGYYELGLVHSQLDQHEKAVVLFRQADKLIANNFNVNMALVYSYTSLLRFKESIPPLELVCKQKPKDASMIGLLAEAYRRTGRYEEAILKYNEYNDISPDKIEVLSSLASCYFELRRLNEAVSIYKKIIELEPGNISAHAWLVSCCQLLGNSWDASIFAEKALNLNPNEPQDLCNLANFYYKNEDYDKAIELCKAAIKKQPTYWFAIEILVACYREVDKHDTVVKVLEAYTKTANPYYKAYVLLGNVYGDKERFEDAVAVLEKAIELNPNAQEAYTMIAIFYQVLGKHQKALEAFEKGLEGNKAYNANMNHLYANSLNSLKKYDGAINYYQKSLGAENDNSSAWHGLGQCYYNLEKYEDAVKAYETSIKLKQDNMEASEDLVIAYEKLNENNKAFDLTLRIIQSSPKDILPTVSLNAWGYNILNYSDVLSSYLKTNSYDLDGNIEGFLYYCLGAVSAELNKPQIASKAYTKSLGIFKQLSKANNNNPYVFWGLGSSCYGLGQYDNAIKHYKTSIRLDSNFVASYARLSFLYSTCPKAKYRNAKTAIELARTACELTNNENEICVSVLAAAQAEGGDFEKAIECQQKAIELVGDIASPEMAEYEERLKAYKAHKPWRE